MFLLWLRQLPCSGDQTPASVPSTPKGRSSPTNIPVFPSSSFMLLSFAWFYIFFSTDQAFLSVLSWYSACTSVSEGVFLMYPWREMYFTSAYSSTILFSPESFLNMAPVHMDYICKMEYVGINFRQERGGERVAKRWQLGMYSSCYFTGWETIQIDETCCIWCKLGC